MSTISISPTDRVFVLTGAGISAESGLPTFRASDGLWAGYRIEDVCTPEAWQRNPALVWEFYSARRAAAAQGRSPIPRTSRSPSSKRSLRGPLLSLHAECRRPARARRLRESAPHARRAGQVALRARVRRAAGRRPRRLREPRRRGPLRLRRPPAPAHCFLRRDSAGDGSHSARDRATPR